jgi:hypothetical protein
MFSPLAGVYTFSMASKTGGSKALVENFRYMVSDDDHMSSGIDPNDIPESMSIGTHESVEFDAALKKIDQRTSVGGLSPLQFGNAPRPVKGDVMHMICMAAGSENPDVFSDLYDFIQLLLTWFGGDAEVPGPLAELIDNAETAAGFVRQINVELEEKLGPGQADKLPKPYKLGDNLEPAEAAAQCPTTQGP